MAGMICSVAGCGHSSNDARPPQCTMSSCPGRQTFALSDFQKAQNLKKAFAEHDIPWPRGDELDKLQAADRDLRRATAAMREMRASSGPVTEELRKERVLTTSVWCERCAKNVTKSYIEDQECPFWECPMEGGPIERTEG